MNLILFTSHYPNDKTADFVADEVEYYAKSFEKVFVFSFANTSEKTKYVPDNFTIIRMKESIVKKNARLLFTLITKFFSILKEYRKSAKLSKKTNIICKLLVITRYLYYGNHALKTYERLHLVDSETIGYSFWLSDEAFCLSKIMKKHHLFFGFSRAHGADLYQERNYLPFRIDIFSTLNQIIPISKEGANVLTKAMEELSIETRANLWVSHLGVKKLSDSLNPFPEKAFRIVSCSSIISVKRIDLLIDALSLLEFPFEWVHFGDGLLRTEMEERAVSLTKNGNCLSYSFMGNVNKKDILQYYSSKPISFFVNCSDSEGIPVSIMEAMAYGIPCIARSSGGTREIVNDTNGILMKHHISPNEFADYINLFHNLSYEEVLSKRKNAYKTFITDFDSYKNYSLFVKNMVNKGVR